MFILVIVVSSLYALAARASSPRDPSQDAAPGSALFYAPPTAFAWSYQSAADAVNVSTRAEVYAFIVDNPGMNVRGISAKLGLPLGDVEYHLWTLMKDGIIVDLRVGRYRRLFEASKYCQEEMKVISMMRQGTTGRILAALSQTSMQHKDLAAKMGVTSQGLTWQIGRLKQAGVVVVSYAERLPFYALNRDLSPIVAQHISLGQ